MYTQPGYTGHRNSGEPSFCSSLIGKILPHKRSPDHRRKNEPQIKQRSASVKRNEIGEYDIRMISKKMRKVTSMLPIVLQSNDAYKTGEKNCETCMMDKEKYKADLQSAKVIGILVDGVIEREQAEEMDDEYEKDINNSDSAHTKLNGKTRKVSLNFSFYCEGDAVTHSLKCVLIKLQKTIGNTMVQICFVKSRKLRNDDRFKAFDVAVRDLKLLKYEYTNITDIIIPLFKNSSATKQNSKDICVPCIKEKLCEYNMRLENVLESGRNLRVVMRNDGPIEKKDQCCSRGYPHIHAEVQGKPIVLKYSMPFQVKNKPTESPSNNAVKIDLPENSPSFQPGPGLITNIPSQSQNSENKDTSLSEDWQSQPNLLQPLNSVPEELKSITTLDDPSKEINYTKKLSVTTSPSKSSYISSKSTLQSKSEQRSLSKTSLNSKVGSEGSTLPKEISKLSQTNLQKKSVSKESEYISTESSESDSEENKSETKSNIKDNKNNSYKTTQNTTAFPVMVKGSVSSNSHIFTKEGNTVPIFMASENPLYTTKEWLSCAGGQVTANKNKSVHNVTGVCQNNQTVFNELLKKLGKDHFLLLCSPAECCKANSFLVEQGSVTDLPLSASLNSLPLDQSDLDYIAKATGKHLSYEDIVLVSEEETQKKAYEWEEQITNVNKDHNPSKWLRSLGETNPHIAFCSNEPPLLQGTPPTMKKANSKTITIKEEPRLSTIAEEGPSCVDQPSTSNSKNIHSLPLGEEQNTGATKNRQSSILKHTTMELRYFTVELIEKMDKINKKQYYESGKDKFKEPNATKNVISTFRKRNCYDEDSENNDNLTLIEDGKNCFKSFNSCSSVTELLHDRKYKNLQSTDFNLSQRKIDEVTMLNAINLSNDNFDNVLNQVWTASNTNFLSLKDSSLDCNNSESMQCLHRHTSNKSNENKVHFGEVNHMKSPLLEIDIKEDTTVNKPNSHIKNINKQCEHVRNQNISLICPEQKLPKENTDLNVNHSESNIDNTLYLLGVTTPSYISVRSNNLLKMFNDYSKNKNNESVILHTQQNKPWSREHNIYETVCLQKKCSDSDLTIEGTGNTLFLNNMSLLTNDSSNSDQPDIASGDSIKSQHSQNNSSGSKLLTKTHQKNKLEKQEVDSTNLTKLTNYGNYIINSLTEPMTPCEFKCTKRYVASPKLNCVHFLPVHVNNQVPIIILIPNKIKASSTKKSMIVQKPFESMPNLFTNYIEKSEANNKDTRHFFGIEKNYISVKKTPSLFNVNNISKSKLIQSKAKKRKLDVVLQGNVGFLIENYRTDNMIKNKKLPKNGFEEETIENLDSDHLLKNKPDCTSEGFIQKYKGDECSLNDHKCNSLYLFDIHSQPNSSGRSVKEDLLVTDDKQKVPICDSNITPLYRTVVHKVSADNCNSDMPLCTEVLTCFRTDIEDPMLLYNIEGLPLTTVSGTMLVDSMGKGLIRFGCTGNPISDCEGRPVLDSTGKRIPVINYTSL